MSWTPYVARYPLPTPGPWPIFAHPDTFDADRHVAGATPFFTHFIHQALASVRRHDLLLASILRWEQFMETGDGTIWEHWVEGTSRRSHVHAWSGTPTYDLPTHFLGVTPATPGFARVSIRPHLAGLKHVAGSVPTPHGPISVQIEIGAEGPTHQVSVPPGVTGSIAFPEYPRGGAPRI